MEKPIDESMQFAGADIAAVAEFLRGTYFEFDGRSFLIRTPGGEQILRPGDTLHRFVDNTYGVEPNVAPEVYASDAPTGESLHTRHVVNVKTRKKRGKKA